MFVGNDNVIVGVDFYVVVVVVVNDDPEIFFFVLFWPLSVVFFDCHHFCCCNICVTWGFFDTLKFVFSRYTWMDAFLNTRIKILSLSHVDQIVIIIMRMMMIFIQGVIEFILLFVVLNKWNEKKIHSSENPFSVCLIETQNPLVFDNNSTSSSSSSIYYFGDYLLLLIDWLNIRPGRCYPNWERKKIFNFWIQKKPSVDDEMQTCTSSSFVFPKKHNEN